MQTEIFTTLLIFLASANCEIIKSTLGYINLVIHTLPIELLRPHLKELVSALLAWSHDHKKHFKAKVRHIFERMIRRFGWALMITIQARTPERGRQPLDISNASLFTPPPGSQVSDPPDPSPSLPRGAGTPVPKSKPRPRPVPRKSRTASTIYNDFIKDDESRLLIGSASSIPASTLAADSIHPPTSPSAVSELIEEVDPAFSIADRAKTRTRKAQVKKPTYEPVEHDVIELTSDSDLDELSLKPPRKRQKSQDKPVKPKPRPKPKPKPKARTSPSAKATEQAIVDTQPSEVPAPQESAFPSQLPSTTSRLLPSLPHLPDLSSPPFSPPVTTRKRKRAPPLESEVHGEDMDVDVRTTSSPSITAPPLFSAQLSPVVPPLVLQCALRQRHHVYHTT
ncbi:hypothetical protein P692DRAFT_20822787 [Suillus brevipes Sb2]|nr:hypothetical protein P692DRAFT_20822787 [Suillus brevipes Sb2]